MHLSTRDKTSVHDIHRTESGSHKNSSFHALETVSGNTMSTSQPVTSLYRSPRRPPEHVFTKGTMGSVKIRRQVTMHDDTRRSRSQSVEGRQGVQERRARSSSTPRSGPITPNKRCSYSDTQHRSDVSSLDPSSIQSSPSFRRREVREPESFSSGHSVRKEERIETPSKTVERQKMHTKTSKNVIDELNRAQNTERRIAAITNACDVFDHTDEARHDIELLQGAAQILGNLLVQAKGDDEIRMICAALEMVYRGSPKSVQGAYESMKACVLAILLGIMDRCESGSMKNPEVSIINILRILLHLSRCPGLRAKLCRTDGLLAAISRGPGRVSNPECRNIRICTLENLSHCEQNRVLMYEDENVFDSILRAAHLDTSDVARQHAIGALMNLASAPANHLPIAKNDRALGTLVKTVLAEKSSSTREAAITALQNLAFTKENRDRLVSFKAGIVLEAIKKSLSTDDDPKARRRAAGTLTNLACDGTAERMTNHKGLLQALAICCSTDINLEVQTRSCLALTKIASYISSPMDCYNDILDALVVASLSKSTNNVLTTLRIMAREVENREAMALHTGVIDTLTDICASSGADKKDKDNAARALMHLVNHNNTCKLLCTKSILDALVAVADFNEEGLQEARDSAIIAMERLATDHSNRPFMARHPNLLQTVAKAVEREASEEDSGKESEHGFLAKPLLMSLLLAM